ncbi:MAG: HEAT repeat domain-containing protein [Anaerolineae bacterium]|jgi:HEAT repeat protein|nr:HEAT repeat domain-containing protein [Anaerolineae bacterium]
MGVIEEIRPLRPGFNGTLAIFAQLTSGQRVPDAVIQGLARLLPSQLGTVTTVWQSLELEARRDVVSALVEAMESDYELDYTLFAEMSITDPDPVVRQGSIELLTEQLTVPHMMRLYGLAQNDAVDEVRAAAMKGLGALILEAELGKLPEEAAAPVIEYLLGVIEQPREDVLVRARALEAVSHSSHDAVPRLIRRAYEGGEPRMKTASIYAMGASSDDAWATWVIRELTSRKPEDRYEAAHAAGELELLEAVPKLSRLAIEDSGQVRNTAIWALGEIGGKEAVRVLEGLLEQVDEDEDESLFDLLEDALDAASLGGGGLFGMSDEYDEMER